MKSKLTLIAKQSNYAVLFVSYVLSFDNIKSQVRGKDITFSLTAKEETLLRKTFLDIKNNGVEEFVTNVADYLDDKSGVNCTTTDYKQLENSFLEFINSL